MDEQIEQSRAELRPARFSDRVVAFSADMALFSAGYLLTLALFFPAYSVFLNPHSGKWKAFWVALFILYQAYFSAEGRVCAGKKLVGIRIVSAEGEPLPLGAAIIRSLAYLVSSILNLGFLWSLFNPGRQCWHDMAVGSIVVEEKPKGPGLRRTLRAAAAACMAFIAGSWYWNNFAAPRYQAIMDTAYARVGLQEISNLQRIHHDFHGRYATSLRELAPLTPSPQVFLADMGSLFDAGGVTMTADKKGYALSARAIDEGGTLVALRGP